jgi:hypothetical protein
MAMVPLPRDTGREPASLAEVPLDGGRYVTLVISREQCTTSGTFPVFYGEGGSPLCLFGQAQALGRLVDEVESAPLSQQADSSPKGGAKRPLSQQADSSPKGGAKFTHYPAMRHLLSCLPLWGRWQRVSGDGEGLPSPIGGRWQRRRRCRMRAKTSSTIAPKAYKTTADHGDGPPPP